MYRSDARDRHDDDEDTPTMITTLPGHVVIHGHRDGGRGRPGRGGDERADHAAVRVLTTAISLGSLYHVRCCRGDPYGTCLDLVDDVGLVPAA